MYCSHRRTGTLPPKSLFNVLFSYPKNIIQSELTLAFSISEVVLMVVKDKVLPSVGDSLCANKGTSALSVCGKFLVMEARGSSPPERGGAGKVGKTRLLHIICIMNSHSYHYPFVVGREQYSCYRDLKRKANSCLPFIFITKMFHVKICWSNRITSM